MTLADGGSDTTVVNTFTADEGNNDLLGEIGAVINSFPLPGASPSSTGSYSDGINLKPFLAPDDGGTGAALRQASAPSRPLNPENFR